MKFVLILIGILVAVAWFKARLQRSAQRPPPPVQPRSVPQVEMVRCAQCGVHLPQTDAEQGRRGWYCSHRHLVQHEPD